MSGFFLDRTALVQQVRSTPHFGIHNFTVGTLTAYFRLETCISSFNADTLILDGLPSSNRRKIFAFNTARPDTALQATGVIYSINRLSLPKESKFAELTYNLEYVFDPAQYENAKKRNQRLKQPFKRLHNYGIVIRALTETDIPGVMQLHEEWCARKLALPETFKMMFPRKRYLNCTTLAIARPQDYIALGAFSDETLLAVHVYFVDKQSAFDLACFTDNPYSNFSEDFYIASLAYLKDHDITYVNCGATLHKRLSAFKQHWPSQYVYSWAYGKLT